MALSLCMYILNPIYLDLYTYTHMDRCIRCKAASAPSIEGSQRKVGTTMSKQGSRRVPV